MPTSATVERGERLGDLTERRRRFLSTTPGQLRAESIVVVVATLLAGLLTSLVVADQVGSNDRIVEEAEPAILNARRVQTSLAEANAAAATAFLVGGAEDTAQRATYEQSIRSAAQALDEATRLVGEPATAGGTSDWNETNTAPGSTGTLSADIVDYGGLIETARANNRQGFPVSAAYLGTASALLEQKIYPQTDDIANVAAQRYRDTYNRQRGVALVFGLLAIALVIAVVLMLVYMQFQLSRRFNRTLNLPLLGASLVAIGLALWMSLAMTSQLSHLTAARDDGYAGTRLYLDLRGTGFGAKADQSRFLIARGAGQRFADDFDQRAAIIEELRTDVDLHVAESEIASATVLADDAFGAWQSYNQVHQEIVLADNTGDRAAAILLAQADAEEAFEMFDQATAAALTANGNRFSSEMAAAQRAMRWLRFGSLAAAIVVAGLAAYGLQTRIDEYR